MGLKLQGWKYTTFTLVKKYALRRFELISLVLFLKISTEIEPHSSIGGVYCHSIILYTGIHVEMTTTNLGVMCFLATFRTKEQILNFGKGRRCISTYNLLVAIFTGEFGFFCGFDENNSKLEK